MNLKELLQESLFNNDTFKLESHIYVMNTLIGNKQVKS